MVARDRLSGAPLLTMNLPGGSLRCVVFRALPKELEEEVNKFLEAHPGTIQMVTQSESEDHLSLTIFYEPDAHEED